ncbi:MAG: transporter substrate-binding domain-containing protein [Pseudomonadales bacterium]|nr:transporter substrate-binding domain-containing protein [Pseudomonadales bacterium]
MRIQLQLIIVNVFIGLTVLVMPFNLYAAAPINIIAYTDYPPYLFYENNQPSGLYLKIVELTLKAINQPYVVTTLPFKRGLSQAESGDGIMIGVLQNDERKQTLDFSDPIYQEKISVFFNYKKTPLIQDISELDGLLIGTLLGWSYGGKFDYAKLNNRFVTRNDELEKNFKLVFKDRLDAVIHTNLSSFYIINKLGLESNVFIGSIPLDLVNIRIAVRKGTYKDLIKKFNSKLNEQEHKNKLAVLIDRYKSL